MTRRGTIYEEIIHVTGLSTSSCEDTIASIYNSERYAVDLLRN